MTATCDSCGKVDGLLWCKDCHTATYCNIDCQKKDWENHKNKCSLQKATFTAAVDLSMSKLVQTMTDKLPVSKKGKASIAEFIKIIDESPAKDLTIFELLLGPFPELMAGKHPSTIGMGLKSSDVPALQTAIDKLTALFAKIVERSTLTIWQLGPIGWGLTAFGVENLADNVRLQWGTLGAEGPATEPGLESHLTEFLNVVTDLWVIVPILLALVCFLFAKEPDPYPSRPRAESKELPLVYLPSHPKGYWTPANIDFALREEREAWWERNKGAVGESFALFFGAAQLTVGVVPDFGTGAWTAIPATVLLHFLLSSSPGRTLLEKHFFNLGARFLELPNYLKSLPIFLLLAKNFMWEGIIKGSINPYQAEWSELFKWTSIGLLMTASLANSVRVVAGEEARFWKVYWRFKNRLYEIEDERRRLRAPSDIGAILRDKFASPQLQKHVFVYFIGDSSGNEIPDSTLEEMRIWMKQYTPSYWYFTVSQQREKVPGPQESHTMGMRVAITIYFASLKKLYSPRSKSPLRPIKK